MSNGEKLTHKTLCDLAHRWLMRPASKDGPGCQFALTETKASAVAEIPDAIGFRYDESIVIEVKVSRADFLKEKDKPHRLEPASGMGLFRYFMAPAGVIDVADIPDRWGLIEVSARKSIKVVRGHVHVHYVESPDGHWTRDYSPWRFERDVSNEIAFLVRMLQRVGNPEEVNRQIKHAQWLHGIAQRRAEKAEERASRAEHELLLVRFAT